jgi:hypothetical protein
MHDVYLFVVYLTNLAGYMVLNGGMIDEVEKM